MSNYYLLQRISFPKGYHDIKPYKLDNQQQVLYAVMAASNCIELHRVLPDGLAFQANYQFFANIVKIEVIPSHQSSPDYLWLLDEKGRYAFWTPHKGFQYASNQLMYDFFPESQRTFNYSSNEVFSGVNSVNGENQSKGQIFFAIGSKITILQYCVKKQGLFLNEAIGLTFAQSYKQIRFANWINNSSNQLGLLGIVIQKQDGETALEVYEVGLGQKAGGWKLGWTVEKKNILQFYSPANNQLLLLTFDQIALYKYKQSPICCYRTGGNYGQGFYLSHGLYGQIGKQLILFSKQKLIPFSSYRFEDEDLFQEGGFKECTNLGELEGIGNVLCILTHRSQVYFLTISGNQHKMRKLNVGLPVIQSLKPLQGLNEFLVVGRCRQDEYGLFLSERIQSAKIVEWQSTPLKIDSLYSAVRGSYLILCCGNSNFVARVTKNNDYSIYFQLPDFEIKATYDEILVTIDGVYQVDYQTQNYYKFVETQIVLAQIIQQVVYFLDQRGTIWRWDVQSKQAQQIMDDCLSDYCWGASQNSQMLICANLHDMTKLRLLTQDGIKLISIKGHTIISSLATIAPPRKRHYSRRGQSVNQELLIGYCDGTIHVQSIDGHILKVFKLRQVDRVVFVPMNQGQVLVRCPFRQYILNATTEATTITGIQLVQQNTYIQQLVYLQKSKKFLLVLKDKLKSSDSVLLQLCLTPENWKSNLTKLSHCFKSLPLILTSENLVFFASSTSVGKLDLRSGKTQQNSHQLKELSGFEKVQMGMMLSGQHSTGKQMIVVWNQSLEILLRCNFTLNQAVRSLKPIQTTNQFMVWTDSSVTFHELQPKSGRIKLLFGSNVPSKGYHSDLCQGTQLFVLNDCDQFVSLYSYDDKVALNFRYVGAYQIIGCSFIGQDLLMFDERNHIMLFTCEKESNKYVLNKQWSINLGQRVAAWCKHNEKVYFITADHSIFCMRPLEKQVFEDLKAIRQQVTKKLQPGFSYRQWRKPVKSEKLIEDTLLLQKAGERAASSPQKQQQLNSLLQFLKN